MEERVYMFIVCDKEFRLDRFLDLLELAVSINPTSAHTNTLCSAIKLS
jgi:hypothetical protein